MMDELRRLRELTEALTGNGYLKDQAKEWEYALDAVPECVYIINNKFEMKFVNKTLADRLGKSKEELFNKICYEEIQGNTGDFPTKGTIDDYKVLKTKSVLEDIYIIKLGGWFNITRSPIYSNSSKLLGFICVLQDVTAKKKALEGLVYREATLDAIYNAAPIGIGLVEDGTRIIVTVNKFLTDLIGYAEKELIGKSVRMLYQTEEEYLRVGIVKYASIEATGVGSLETQFVTKGGDILDIFLKSTRIKSGKFLVFTVTDITDRKKRERQLKLNEERLKSVLELTKMSYKKFEEISSFALEEAVRLTDSKIGYLHFVNNNLNEEIDLTLFQWSDATNKDCVAVKVPHYPLSTAGSWADCIRERRPIIENDYKNMTFAQGKKGLPKGHIEITKYMSVPIIDNDRIVAVAGVGNKDLAYDDTDLRQLNLFMNSMWDILKRQGAEEEVKRNKLYFERLLNTTPISILVYKLENENLVLKYFNNTAVVTLKMEDTLIIGKYIEELFPMLSGLPIVDIFKNIAKNGGAFSDPVYKYECESLEYIFFVNAFQSDTDEVSVLFYDTTEQIKLHSEAQNGRDKFKLVFDNCSDAITILRQSDGVISDVNPAFERYTGYKKEEIIGKTLTELNLWDSKKDSDVFNDLIKKDSLVVDFPADLKLKDGIMKKSLISSIVVYINEVPHVVSIARIYDKDIIT